MTTNFLHGVEVVELTSGVRPIQTVRSSVIGLIGTAPAADAAVFPLNEPVLIAGSRSKANKLGTTGTLGPAMDGIFQQIGATVVVVRVDEGADDAATLANVAGSATAQTGARLYQSRVNARHQPQDPGRPRLHASMHPHLWLWGGQRGDVAAVSIASAGTGVTDRLRDHRRRWP